MNQKERKKIISEIEKKYFDLVWYARKDVNKLTRTDILKKIESIEDKYPEETNSLNIPEEADWSHGFNSGMLAGMRFVLSLMDKREGYEIAIEEFPFLDT